VGRSLALACGLWVLTAGAPAQTLSVLYTFTNGVDGALSAGLMQDTNGSIYGTAVDGGTNGWGSIYEMSRSGTLKPLYSFKGGVDGGSPYAALARGTNGLFYGMAQVGGSNDYGTIFEVTSNGSFTSLYSFHALRGGNLTNADGATPRYALTLGTNGNFYGTATQGGTNGQGTVFEVTHQGKVTVLYSFSNSVDGAAPSGPLLQFTNGLLYGTAIGGGSNGYGTVFEVTAAGKVTAIYSFTNGIDGATPQAGVINGHDGYLYGTCTDGGANDSGTVFKITPGGNLTPLYSFGPSTNYPDLQWHPYNADGIAPRTLLLGADGSFYGGAYYGGQNGSGTIFQLTPGGVFAVLYTFNFDQSSGTDSDGANPLGLLQASDGNFYGTAYEGGATGDGTFFRLGLPPQITLQPTNQSVELNDNAVFTLSANGALSCQWQFDTNDIANATGYTLSLTNVQITNAGYYQAIVTNINGATTSAVVTLRITNVPLSFAAGASAAQYSSGQFTLTLTNLTGQGTLVIEASSDLRQWTPVFTNPPAYGTLPFIDANAGAYTDRFYRAVTP
jgi:uncharacterized repeat protein (TIGR03803 family)